MTSVWGWGCNSCGQIGVESEEDVILLPTCVNFFTDFTVVGIACGWNHTVFWMSDGLVYSNGLNDNSQLGYTSENDSCRNPAQIKFLETQNIVNASCGKLFTILVNDNGLIYSCGNNAKGQLGIELKDDAKSLVPQHVKSIPAHIKIVKVSCGKNHTLALSAGGDVYCWGGNKYGQCGTGVTSDKPVFPQQLEYLFGIPVYSIAAGGNHSIAVTVSGTLFSWGKNGFGQLGLGDSVDRLLPTKIQVLTGKPVCHIACGEAHTVVLTSAGGVYSFGAGSSGQLGHNSFDDEHNPKKITEFMGTVITQIACGRNHSIAYNALAGQLYSFGLGASGEIGSDSLEKKNSPIVTKGKWAVDRRVRNVEFLKHINNNNTAYFEEDCDITVTSLVNGNSEHVIEDETDLCIQEIFAGGLDTFVTMVNCQSIQIVPSIHCMIKQGNLLFLTQTIVENMMDGSIPIDTAMDILSIVFSNAACLNASFLEKDKHGHTSFDNHGVLLMSVRKSFAMLASNENFIKIIILCLKEYLIPSFSNLLIDPEASRVFLMIPELPFFNVMSDMQDVIIPFVNSFVALQESAQKIVMNWWSKLPATFFERNITPYKNCIVMLLEEKLPETTNAMIFSLHDSVKSCFMLLKKLDLVNNENVQNQSGGIVPYSTFYIDCLAHKINILHDYINWIRQPQAFSFCKFPFAFNVKAKAELLQIDADRQMHYAVGKLHMLNIVNLVQGKIQIQTDSMLVFRIRREHIVQDTLSQIVMRQPHEMKRPLKIEFSDEEAEDAGGVRKEFFLLLMKEILDPKYGMFDYYEESRVIWFRSQSFEDPDLYMLIGVICGLAIYNTTIIDFPFPVCLYKKLLNNDVNLDDLRGLQPGVAKSLQVLLDYQDDDFSDVFGLTFQIIELSFGASNTIDLVPNGGNIPVTNENKGEYVDAYIKYRLNSSVDKEFQAFSHGFHRVCGGPVLNLFHPQELMEFIVGSRYYDFSELEEAASYKGDYGLDHPVIKRFWEVFRDFSMEMKKKFLIFLTGSDKVSIFGMKNMKFVIQPVAVSEGHLPVAHTCFNLLDLPQYSSVEVLRKKLCQAIENFQGFALV